MRETQLAEIEGLVLRRPQIIVSWQPSPSASGPGTSLRASPLRTLDRDLLKMSQQLLTGEPGVDALYHLVIHGPGHSAPGAGGGRGERQHRGYERGAQAFATKCGLTIHNRSKSDFNTTAFLFFKFSNTFS